MLWLDVSVKCRDYRKVEETKSRKKDLKLTDSTCVFVCVCVCIFVTLLLFVHSLAGLHFCANHFEIDKHRRLLAEFLPDFFFLVFV